MSKEHRDDTHKENILNKNADMDFLEKQKTHEFMELSWKNISAT